MFLDTNILLDIFQKRELYYEDAVELVRGYPGDIFISTLSLPNISYIAKIKKKDRTKLKAFISGFRLVDLTSEIIRDAFKASTPDLEDAIQIVSCMEVSDTFITRNKKDFSDYNDVLDILTPREFLSLN